MSAPQKRFGPGSGSTLSEATNHIDRIRNSSALDGYRALMGPVHLDTIEQTGSRLPPYGKEVEQAAREERYINVAVFAGPGAWDRAASRRKTHGAASTLVLPPNEPPATYRWPVIPGGVMVVAHDRKSALELAQAIVSDGTPLAFAIFGDADALIVRSPAWVSPLSDSMRAAA